MITRARVRRWACWAGAGVGVVSVGAIAFTLFASPVVVRGTDRLVFLRCGAVEVYWQARTRLSPNTGAPSSSAGGRSRWRWIPKLVEENRIAIGERVQYSPGEFILPLWIPAVLGGLCVYWLLPERAAWHTCATCGYDLRSIPTTNGLRTCPECGTVGGRSA